MPVKVTFYGGADSQTKGELGGVMAVLNRLGIDCGMPPDRFSRFKGFPNKFSSREIALMLRLGILPPLKGVWREDVLRHENLTDLLSSSETTSDLDGIAITHPHYDHIGLFNFLDPRVPVYLSRLAKQIALVWQLTTGLSYNQFVASVSQFDRTVDQYGEEVFAKGLEALIPRHIKIYEPGQPFSVGEMNVTAYPVDHSTPGSHGFIIETPRGKVGWSGDIRCRGRHPERTQQFVEALLKADLKYLFWEGSLLHFEHEGTEEDVTKALTDLIKDKQFVSITYPPRDLDRIISVYQAAKATKRMLLIPPAQALMLKMLNGVDGGPRLDWKYLGVLLLKKNKATLDRQEEFSSKLIEQDYYGYEQPFLRDQIVWQDYAADEKWRGHQSKLQRVSIEDVSKYQDQFIVYVSSGQMALEVYSEVNPAKNSVHVRSHPAAFTVSMEEDERRLINVLTEFDLYDGPQPDYLTPTILRNMHQIHVSGHLNRRETRTILEQFQEPTVIVPMHCLNPQDFPTDVARHLKVLIPERNVPFLLY